MQQVFAIGDKIEITPVKSAFSYETSEKRYTSQMLDFDDVRMAKIAAPVQDGRLIPLRVDEDIDLCFFTKNGLYQCRARVKDRYTENKVSMLDVLFVSEPKKFQRRRFFRLDCSFEISYRRLSREEVQLRQDIDDARSLHKNEELAGLEKQLEELPKNWETATLTNLSGGGIRFHLSEALEVGEQIEVEFPISLKAGARSMCCMAHVIESGRSDDMRSNSMDARCEFDSVSERERELIVKYIFEEQRRRMSGGER